MDLKDNMEEKARYFGMYVGIAQVISKKDINLLTSVIYVNSMKLILKPLSELSEEDAVKIFDCVDNDCNKLIAAINQGFYDDITLSEWFQLAQLGYAIPVLGKHDPFELGWAIRKMDV